MEFGPDVCLDNAAFIHPTAQVYGRVTIDRGASLWPNAVIRAEAYEVVVGEYTNIQDFVMVHVGDDGGAYIGSHCSIAHHAVVHGARVGDNCLIGVNATLMDGCVVGDNCIVAGGSFVTENTVIPDNSIVMGVPAAVRRRRNNWVRTRMNALLYYRNALAYAEGGHRVWSEEEFQAAERRERARLEAEFAATGGAADT